jgi:hypothetical protein
MSYELSFSPEFFFAEGEPYDTSELSLDEQGRPTSVYSALSLIAQNDPARWREIADSIGMDAEYVSVEDIVGTIIETNTCSNIDTPVHVWVDPEGEHTVAVY